jgi:uncharacterized protein YndB with AHSA1/START domain
MTTQTADTTVRTAIDVDVPVDHAFKVFTEDIGSWWNPDHHIIEAKLDHMVFEPRVGGHIYDVGVDGSECRWATVLAYEPPHRLVFTWNINLEWRLETDPARVSEVEVTFAERPEGGTHVTLTHRELQRHGEGWESMRAGVGAEEGWPGGLRLFAAYAQGPRTA